MAFDPASLGSLRGHWLVSNSNIPRRFWTTDHTDVEAFFGKDSPVIKDWKKDLLGGKIIKAIGGVGVTGVGLLIDGLPGLGKTTRAVSVLNDLLLELPSESTAVAELFHIEEQELDRSFVPVYYTTFTDFLALKKAAFTSAGAERDLLDAKMEGLHGRSTDDRKNVRVLVLDDIGKEYGSKYDDFSFDELLRSRYDKALPTIVTTNVDRSNWDVEYSEAMGSFAHEAFRRVKLKGLDRRIAGGV
jgi:DNA replication protein DnaC